MSSKFKRHAIALVVLGLVFGSALAAKADVTGSFGTHFLLIPQTTASEISPLLIDLQNELNINYVVSGLISSFHTHFGIAGVEDIIVGNAATLGALDLSVDLVFGRFAFGSIDPFYDELHFIKKIFNAGLNLSGVFFSNLVVIEDANAFGALSGTVIPNLGTLGDQSSIYAFGDVLRVAGQTPSGVSLTFETGICMDGTPNLIKKHFLLPYSVNPECVTAPKPDILFDFETVSITGVPIAPGVSASGTISCVTTNPCTLSTAFTFNTPTVPIPFTSTFTFSDLTSLSFSGANLVFTAGAGTLVVNISSTGTIAAVSASINATLNPDTNPASLIISGNITPGVGLTGASVTLAVTRLGFTTSATASFGGGPPATFQDVTFAVDVPGGLVSLSAVTVFDATGMIFADIEIEVNF